MSSFGFESVIVGYILFRFILRPVPRSFFMQPLPSGTAFPQTLNHTGNNCIPTKVSCRSVGYNISHYPNLCKYSIPGSAISLNLFAEAVMPRFLHRMANQICWQTKPRLFCCHSIGSVFPIQCFPLSDPLHTPSPSFSVWRARFLLLPGLHFRFTCRKRLLKCKRENFKNKKCPNFGHFKAPGNRRLCAWSE